ncbi:sperm acrosome membrane-associated protein 4 [Puntigrus tetrazona]|uniref:sperm acrosome membrane-associated protein 4 n=1 Tax=Puntigrus tetrazona TaxID=1606681 RepID=UPI001C8AC9EF|nr:sperm acrosome membrane-associated protein 4 [Puntigrus tetrazona]
MNKILLGVFAVALCFAAGQALQCYECKVGFWNLCITSKITCNTGERCFSGLGKAAKFVNIIKKGCLEVASCNKTEQLNFPSNSTILYEMTKTCCSTDLCNSAPGHFHVSALSMAFTTVSSLFVVKFVF